MRYVVKTHAWHDVQLHRHVIKHLRNLNRPYVRLQPNITESAVPPNGAKSEGSPTYLEIRRHTVPCGARPDLSYAAKCLIAPTCIKPLACALIRMLWLHTYAEKQLTSDLCVLEIFQDSAWLHYQGEGSRNEASQSGICDVYEWV